MDGFVCLDAADALDDALHELQAPAWPTLRAKPMDERASDYAARPLRAERLKSRIRRPLSPICPFPVSELPEETFWQQAWVQNAVPLISSIIVHTIVLTLGVIGYRAAVLPARNNVVVEGSISSIAAPVGVQAPLSNFPDAPERIDDPVQAGSIHRSEPYDPFRGNEVSSGSVAFASLPSADDAAAPATPVMLGMGANALTAKPNFGPSSSAEGNAVLASTTGAGGNGSRASDAAFFGFSGNAKSVVYVCDASASMIGSNEAIVSQLQRAVLALHPSQAFNVIFFSGNVAPMMLNKEQLVPADPDNKLAAVAFARRYSPKGATPCLPAIRAALEYHPEMLNFVTDGEMEDADAVVTNLRQMNRDRQTKFNVILVTAAARVNQSAYQELKRLAEESGGSCRIVDPFAQN